MVSKYVTYITVNVKSIFWKHVFRRFTLDNFIFSLEIKYKINIWQSYQDHKLPMLCYIQFSLVIRTTVRNMYPAICEKGQLSYWVSQSTKFWVSFFVFCTDTRKEYFNSEYERYIFRHNFLIRRPFPRQSWNNFKALKTTYDVITQWSRAPWITSHKTLGNLWHQNVPCRFHKSSPLFFYSVSHELSLLLAKLFL